MVEMGLVPLTMDCNRIFKTLSSENSIQFATLYFNLVVEVGPNPNLMTFSTLIYTFCKQKRLDKAFHLYCSMIQKVVTPNLVVYNILIENLFKHGKLEAGQHFLCEVLDYGTKFDVVIFSSIIGAFVWIENFRRAVEVYYAILMANILPNIVTYNNFIDGLCKKGQILEGKLTDTVLYNV
ncbi:hypothetical protein Nepgr_019364 [Nepenthes gracilis]|uniref:Pentatricopeptide repeat-containing protein n=1 Tax=Nepenthes gracilis TaxID=150966 RepID=A0AAD3STA4_NEPGR|nr:hypothetical protein Nepgr_019364 [Nepenthes gracilis]